MQWVKSTLAVAFVLTGGPANAQATATDSAAIPAAIAPTDPAAVAAATEPSPTVRIPAGTIVVLEVVETLSSRTSQTGQTFELRLAAPIVIDGQTVVETGALGGGEVIDAARAGMGGRQGKLVVSGRFVEVNGQRVRIRGMQALVAGEDNTREAVNTMILVPYVGFLGGFIQGGDIEIFAGTRAQARLAVDVAVPRSALPSMATVAEQDEPAAAAQGEPAAVEQEQVSGVEGTQ